MFNYSINIKKSKLILIKTYNLTTVYVIIVSLKDKLKVKMIKVEKTYRDLTVTTANLIKKYNLEPTLVFCEDKITLALEQEVVAQCGGSLFCQITTLNRFLHKTTPIDKVCSKHTQALIVKKILSRNSQLKVFNKSSGYSSAGAIAELISQLKSAKVTPRKLMESADSFKGLFQNKIQDVATVFAEYEDYLSKNGLMDINNKFGLLLDALNAFDLPSYRVIISGFQSVTAQTAQAFSLIYSRAKSVDFVCLAGERIYTNEFYNFAKSLDDVEQPSQIKTHERYRLLSALYNEEKSGLYSDKVRFYEFGDETQEIITVAESIKNQVINGAKYGDFLVACPQLSSSRAFIKKTFDDYEVPYYLEESYELSSHPLIRAICKYLDLFGDTFDIADYKNFIKETAIFGNAEFVDGYLTHVNKYAYSEKSILKPLEEDEQEYEEFRKFSLSFPKINKDFTTEQTVEAVMQMLQMAKVQENLESLAQKLKDQNEFEKAEFVKQGYQKTVELLGELSTVLAGEKTLVKDFKSALCAGAKYLEFSVIPQRHDRVYIGDFSACKYRNAEHLFVIGLNDDYPSAMKDTAIFNDTDLKRLDKIKVVIDPKLDIVNKRAKEDLCVCLAGFEKSLMVSYSKYSFGEQKIPCQIFDYLIKEFSDETRKNAIYKYSEVWQKTFNNATIEQKADLVARKYLTENVALKNFATGISQAKYQGKQDDFSCFYSATSGELGQKAEQIATLAQDDLQTTKIEKMGDEFFTDGKISASTVESFYDCPYKNFLTKALKLADDQDGQIKVYEFGNLLHAVCEQFVIVMAQGGISSEEEVKIVVNRLIEALICQPEYAKYRKKAQNERFFELIKEEAERVTVKIYKDSLKTEFKTKFVEYEFGFGNDKGIEIKTKKGDYQIKGKIDRVDFCNDLVRIIDYKTGKTKTGSSNFESEENLYMGKKIQLYLYLNLFLQKGYNPAGVYYAPINDDYKKLDDNPTASLQGKTVCQEEIFKKSDIDFDGKTSSLIGTVKTRNDFSKTTTITDGQLRAYSEYAKLLTAKAVEQIKDGQAVVSPVEGACEYCSFKGICGLQKERYCTRKTIKPTAEELEEIVNGDKK